MANKTINLGGKKVKVPYSFAPAEGFPEYTILKANGQEFIVKIVLNFGEPKNGLPGFCTGSDYYYNGVVRATSIKGIIEYCLNSNL